MKSYSIKQFRLDYPDEQACLDKVFQLTYKDLNICPKCSETTKFRRIPTRRCYQCTKCYHQIYPCASTIFDKSRTPLMYWFYAMFLFTASKNGISACELQRQIGVTYKTAWRILKHIRILLSNDSQDLFTNTSIIEVDETFVGGKNKNRHTDKKVAQSQGRSFKDKVPVLGMLERGGQVKSVVIDNTSSKQVKPHLYNNIPGGAIVMSDEWHAYKGLGSYYNHSIVDHSKKCYVNGETSTNGIENFWSVLKRTFNGSYIHISKKYLQLYVDECVFRFNHKKDVLIFNSLLNCLSS
jgi:transposase